SVPPSSAASLLRQWVQAPAEATADLGRPLVLGQEDLVRALQGQQLPFLLNYFPAQDLPERPPSIHEEEGAVRFRYVGSTIHGVFPPGQGRLLFSDLPGLASSNPAGQTAYRFFLGRCLPWGLWVRHGSSGGVCGTLAGKALHSNRAASERR